MLFRVVVALVLLGALSTARAQDSAPSSASPSLEPSQSAVAAPDSAWLDLRQIDSAQATTQAAPSWVESVSFASTKATKAVPAKSIFRIRIVRPNDDCQILLFRLFFDDDPKAQPQLIASLRTLAARQ